MRGQNSPARFDYSHVYKEVGKKDVPLAVVIVVGVFLWVAIFGSVVAFALLSPCKFTELLVGQDTFIKFKDPKARPVPCDPAKSPSCIAWPLDTAKQCGCFLRITVMGQGGPSCADYP